jgi:hypothetical protein
MGLPVMAQTDYAFGVTCSHIPCIFIMRTSMEELKLKLDDALAILSPTSKATPEEKEMAILLIKELFSILYE